MRLLLGLFLTLCVWALAPTQPAHANVQCVSLQHPTRVAESYLLCAAIGEDNRVYTTLRPEAGGDWTGWKARSGAVQGDLDCAASTGSPSRGRDWFRVDCFARAADGSLRQIIDGGDASTPEGEASALAATLSGAPSCVSTVRQLYCFGRNDSNNLMANAGHIGRGWVGWANLAGVTNQDPECVRGPMGMTHCFVRNADRGISVISCAGWSSSGACARAWLNGDGVLESKLSCVAQPLPEGAPGTQPHFDCFVRGTDNAIHQIRYTNNAFQGWRQINPGRVRGDPSCVVTGVDRYLCAARDEGDRLAFTRYDGASWSAWQTTGDAITGSPHCVFSVGRNETVCNARHRVTGEVQQAVIPAGPAYRVTRISGLRLRE